MRHSADRVGRRARLTNVAVPISAQDNKHLNKENDHGRGEGCCREMLGMCGDFRVIRASGVDLAPVGLGRIQGLTV